MLEIDEMTDAADPEATPRHASGNWNPSWEPFAALDPAWTEKAVALAIAPAVSGALDAKTIELVQVALDSSCSHPYVPGVRRHVRRALQAGATKEEITAVLQLACLQGLHSMRIGAPILVEELATRRSRKPGPGARDLRPPTQRKHT